MDYIFFVMDNFSIHLSPFPRRFPSGLPVETIGFIARKRSWIRTAFQTCNFSFILEGGGEYRAGPTPWAVRAPCVITQWPGRHVEYGPSRPSEWWTELFLIYGQASRLQLQERGFDRQDRPAWSIESGGTVGAIVQQLMELLQGQTPGDQVDRIDRLCESLLLESLLARTPPTASPDQAIQAIRRRVRESFVEPHDFDTLALEHGLSPSTFRRAWNRIVRVPPARYVMRIRLLEACRLLVETPLSIRQIADRLGYHDPLYFSRKFRHAIGMTATDYRTRHRPPVWRVELPGTD
ncbi:MAG: hypothetical protein A2269_08235 [Lentisphaerae bacterium RIFOXYA12_FULL_60_10]|nr:MAG: hypothetical protein A2269_08235 [Lentisphaerae bacterium RIFOXYA12_FULL_60_10]